MIIDNFKSFEEYDQVERCIVYMRAGNIWDNSIFDRFGKTNTKGEQILSIIQAAESIITDVKNRDETINIKEFMDNFSLLSDDGRNYLTLILK